MPYIAEIGFTHLELLPVTEHPLDISWGYQPIGLFAPTKRFGAPEAFARFVDKAHAAGIGVILDWVPAHFPVDAHGLAWFDGSALYEHPDPRKGFHPDWNTAIYDFGRSEVANFLIASALYWLDRFHIDGLRVDAVASMLYLDYSRKPGEWSPNDDGSNDQLRRHQFRAAHQRGRLWAVSGRDDDRRGIDSFSGRLQAGRPRRARLRLQMEHGVDARFAQIHVAGPDYRRWQHNDITFGMHYAYTENFILPLSHDEVVYGKRSIVSKMPGDEWQRFANARAYYGFMWAHPGKKLLFMGQDSAKPRNGIATPTCRGGCSIMRRIRG